jgi:hypothetical protein
MRNPLVPLRRLPDNVNILVKSTNLLGHGAISGKTVYLKKPDTSLQTITKSQTPKGPHSLTLELDKENRTRDQVKIEESILPEKSTPTRNQDLPISKGSLSQNSQESHAPTKNLNIDTSPPLDDSVFTGGPRPDDSCILPADGKAQRVAHRTSTATDFSE